MQRTGQKKLFYSLEWRSQADERVNWKGSSDTHNFYPPINIEYGKPFIFCLTIDATENDDDLLQQKILFVSDGEIQEFESYIEKNYYDGFVSEANKKRYIEIGRCNISAADNFCYLKGLCFDVRLYNQGLNSDDAKAELSILSDLFHI